MSDSEEEHNKDENTQMISGLPENLQKKVDAEMSECGPRLVVVQGGEENLQYELSQGTTTVGRHPSSDIYLDDITVSRQHAEILLSTEGGRILDMASLNGTYVNKERIEAKDLIFGDEIQIGKFKFLYQ